MMTGQALRGDEEEGEETGHVEGPEDDALPPPRSAWQLPGGEEGEDARRECPHQCREDRMPRRKGVGGDDVRRPPHSRCQGRQSNPGDSRSAA